MSIKMGTAADLSIRPYGPEDRESVRGIAYETSFLGRAHLFIEDKELVADALTLYFTDHEPESCFVAVHSGEVVGYLSGTTDIRRMKKIFRRHISGHLFRRAFRTGLIFKPSFLRFMGHVGVGFLKGEFRVPACERQYPALYHINLARGFRGSGTGSRLVKCFENHLTQNHVFHVHVRTMTGEGKHFFVKNGYRVLYEGRRSYLKYHSHSVSPYYILGKELTPDT